MLKKTALHDLHLAASAKMMPFAGYDMPLRYGGDKTEHMAVRRNVGVFDVSHMGEFLVRGPYAFELLQRTMTNNIEKLAVGKAMYTAMLTHQGGVVDDLIIYRLGEELYLLVVNAANIEKDWTWLNAHNQHHALLEDISDQTSLIALAGPQALKTAQKLTDAALAELPYYALTQGTFAGQENVLIATTGYTGERGFELYCRNAQAPAIWEAILEAGEEYGIERCGLGARDTLRLEMGYLLYGNDMNEEINPLEVGLGWVTKLKKGDFVGRERTQALKENGLKRKLVAFQTLDRGIPRAGQTLCVGEAHIGSVTSGAFSPSLNNGIGMGLVPEDYALEGAEFDLETPNGKRVRCRVEKPPFVKETSLARWLNK